jgi:hypothetical protein
MIFEQLTLKAKPCNGYNGIYVTTGSNAYTRKALTLDNNFNVLNKLCITVENVATRYDADQYILQHYSGLVALI